MLRRALLCLLILLVALYVRHLWFVNINAYLSADKQQFAKESVLVLQQFFASISWVAILEKASHFVFFLFNLGLSSYFLKRLFKLKNKVVLLYLTCVVGVFLLAVASFALFGSVDFIERYAKWLVVNLQSPLLFMLSFFVFYIFNSDGKF